AEEKKLWIAVENAFYRGDFSGIDVYAGGKRHVAAPPPPPTPTPASTTPPWGSGRCFPPGRAAAVTAVVLGALFVAAAAFGNELTEDPPRPTATTALPAGHRVEGSDL